MARGWQPLLCGRRARGARGRACGAGRPGLPCHRQRRSWRRLPPRSHSWYQWCRRRQARQGSMSLRPASRGRHAAPRCAPPARGSGRRPAPAPPAGRPRPGQCRARRGGRRRVPSWAWIGAARVRAPAAGSAPSGVDAPGARAVWRHAGGPGSPRCLTRPHGCHQCSGSASPAAPKRRAQRPDGRVPGRLCGPGRGRCAARLPGPPGLRSRPGGLRQAGVR